MPEGSGPRWIEGVDFEVLEDGKVRCLHCQKILESKAGLGPHLVACPERRKAQGEAGGGPTAPSKSVPEEYDRLLELLEDHGVKHAKPICDLMSYRSWDDLQALQEYLELSGVRRDRQKLIIEGWSAHRGVSIPAEVMATLVQPSLQPSGYYQTEFVTKRDLDLFKKDLQDIFEKQTLLAKLESLEKKVTQPQSQSQNQDLQLKFFEFLRDRINSLENKVSNQPSFFEQLAGFEKVLTMLGYQKAGKTTIDVVDAVSERVDRRAAQLLERFYPAATQFQPEIKRVPEERLKKAEEIQKKLEKSEEVLLAEEELVKAASRVRPRGSSS